MRIRLLGAAEALLAKSSCEVPDGLRTGEIVRALAAEDHGLRGQLMTDDGGFRRSSRVIIDGVPVTDYDAVIPVGATVVVAPTLSCDG